MLTLEQVRDLAITTHWGQRDKAGAPYYEHLRAVSDGLKPLGDEHLQMAAWLHDILEDTPTTVSWLMERGVPHRVVLLVEALTKSDSGPYQRYIDDLIAYGRQDAVLVKIADNAHNSLTERLAHVSDPATRDRLELKYRQARQRLWGAVPEDWTRMILEKVNPSLLAELEVHPSQDLRVQ